MTDEVLKALAVGVPAAVAVIATVWMFLKHIEKQEEQRIANAKDLAVERREHDLKIQRMHSDNIRIILAKQDETFELISQALKEHEGASEDRYKKLGVTQELIKAVEASNKQNKT